MGYRGSPEVAHDLRGFGVRFYSDRGNWDLVGINEPVFFIGDAIKFPDFVHANRPSAVTGVQDPDLAFNSFAHPPGTTRRGCCVSAAPIRRSMTPLGTKSPKAKTSRPSDIAADHAARELF